jgi:hypothetical protein
MMPDKKQTLPTKGTIKHDTYAKFGHEVMKKLEEHDISTKIVRYDWGDTTAIDDVGGSPEEVLSTLHLDIREVAIDLGLLKP